MDSFAWVIICLVLIWMRNSGTKCHVIKRWGYSATGVAPQTCGTNNNKFYCAYDPAEKCKSRSQRCTGSNICNNPNTNKEDDCLETPNPGEYYVLFGHAKLSDSSGKKRSIRVALEHQFVTFRGFTYEFGKSYGVQVLDIADPIYKYKNGQHLNDKGIGQIGRSYCNWKDANLVVEMWRSEKYKLITNNCQEFADALSYILIYGTCNQPAAARVKRNDNDIEFSQYVDRQLRNCSLVCCYDDSSLSSAITSHNSNPLAVLVFVIMIFVVVTLCKD